MLLDMHVPTGPLAQFCETYIYYKGFMPDHSIERMVSDGSVYLIYELDGFERHVFDNDTLEPKWNYRGAWLSGAQNHYISLSAHENSEMFVVKFKPGGARLLLGNQVSEFTDKILPIETVIPDSVGKPALALRGSLMEADLPAAKFEVMNQWLESFINDQTDTSSLVDDLVAAIRENATTKLKDIIADSDYSQKQLIHRFKQSVGLTPKAFQRIVRFNEILPLVMEKQSISWNKICVECDYYDQSHFIREFKKFAGYNPGDFLVEQADHEGANFFPLDDKPGFQEAEGRG